MSPASSNSSPAAFSEKRIVTLLCLLAGIHVCIFSAAFPFFNIVDEQYHFDLVVRYSSGSIPQRIEPISEAALPYIAIYSTPEYFWPLSAFPNGEIPPPLWMQPERMMPHVLKTQEHWKQLSNHEAAQPPLYYTLAGQWWRLARLCGLDNGPLLYALRGLNVFFVMALTWVGYAAARLVFPENAFVRIGVPTLVAFLPQTTFYSINNDVLLPLTFGAAFVCLIRLTQEPLPRTRLGLATGLALAATYLVKVSSFPVIAVALLWIALKAWRSCRLGTLRAAWPGLAACAMTALVPIGGWLAWTRWHFGDFTGAATKIQFLGWTAKPFAQWLDHPIFTLQGLWVFISGLMATFWQGEFLWLGQPMTFPAVNAFYAVLSLGFVGIALINLSRQRAGATAMPHPALWLGFWCFAASVAFLALLSTFYDFHDCFYPSRNHPYFTSGRLLGATLIPVLLLFVYGMDLTLSRLKGRRVRPVALAGFVLFMLTVEIAVDWPVFFSAYNWFHM